MYIVSVVTAFVLINSELGSDASIIKEVKQMLDSENSLKYEIQGVYGIYDIVIKITADKSQTVRAIITNQIRKISRVQSTLTMMVIEEQD
ncbi:MAG: AsnC family protein [Cenarchaeum symbiont of Oopsacas minuta]|nr:AsnC family protein [Cenarchaeum symbiont of Oopsacas minuta]